VGDHLARQRAVVEDARAVEGDQFQRPREIGLAEERGGVLLGRDRGQAIGAEDAAVAGKRRSVARSRAIVRVVCQ
jgi:hypothetical protein